MYKIIYKVTLEKIALHNEQDINMIYYLCGPQMVVQ